MAQKYVLRKIGKHLCNVVLVAGTSAQLLAPLVHADEVPASPATEVAQNTPVASPEVATPTTATPTSATAETEGNTTVEPERVVETTLAPPAVGPNGEGTETNPPTEKPVAEQQHKFSYNLNIEYEYQGSVIKVDATRTVDVPDRASADKGLDAESSEIQAKTGQMMIKDGIQYRLASVKSITKEAFEEGPTRTHVNMKIRFELEVIDQTTGETPTSETPTSETPTSETPTSETPTSETPTSETQQPRPAETFVTMTMVDNKGAFVQPKVRWNSPLDVETTYPLGSQILVDETYYEVVVVHAESIVTPRPDMDRDLREIAYTVEVKPVRTVRFGYELNTIYRYKDKQVKFEKVINVYDTRQTRNGVLTMAIYNFRNNTTDVVAQNVHYKVKSIREEAGDKEIRHGESIQVVNLIVELDLANPVILNQDEAPTPDLQEKPEAEAPTSETGGSEELPAPDENVPTSETPTSETPTSEEVVPNKDNENPVVPSDTKPEPALVTTETPTTVSETPKGDAPKDATGPGTSQDEPSADVTGKDQPVIENNANHLVGGGQTTEKPKEESSDKERLPETGTESVIGTVIAGIGSILGSIGLVARKKQ